MGIQILITFIFGIVVIIMLIVLAIVIPNPSPFQDRVFRTIMALAAAGIGAMIPGFIDVEFGPIMGLVVRAGGAIALFTIVYFFTPALLGAVNLQDNQTDQTTLTDDRISSSVAYVIVHEEGNKAKYLTGADVTLILDEPVSKTTGQNGAAKFTTSVQYIGTECIVNATKTGYEERKPLTIQLTPGIRVFIPLVPVKNTPTNEKDTSTPVAYAIVHEKGNKTKCVADAYVTIILHEPVEKKTSENGTAIFTIPTQYIGKECIVNASKDGYAERMPSTFQLSPSMKMFISLEPLKNSPATEGTHSTVLLQDNQNKEQVKNDCDKNGDTNSQSSPSSLRQGPLWIGDPTYVPRSSDELMLNQANESGETLIIRAPAKMGKTSLLNRYLAQCEKLGKLTCLINLAEYSQHFDSFSALLSKFAGSLLDELQLDHNGTLEIDSPVKLRYFIEKEILCRVKKPVVIAIDEADLILGQAYQTNFLRMFRTWHERRANHLIWQELDIVLVISYKPAFLVKDAYSSPFNVAFPVELQPFTFKQAKQLNQSYKNVFDLEQLENLWTLVQGHPYLLHLLFLHRCNQHNQVHDFSSLSHDETMVNGIFSDHLNSLLKRINLNPEHKLPQAMHQITESRHCSDDNAVNRLLAMGVIRRDEKLQVPANLVPANKVYERFFGEFL